MAYERNARTHSDEQISQLMESIREFGFTNPVLIDNNNKLIAGHGRTVAAKLIGMETVPAIRLSNLTDNQIKALRIADNQLALNAGWDMELLTHELKELESDDFALALLGFESELLDDILDGTFLIDEEFSDQVDDDPVPDRPSRPVSMYGDLWLLGDHRLLCGDSTRIDMVEQLMNDRQADLLLTDPPYNVDYEGGTDKALRIMNDNMANDDFRQFLRDVYSSADAVMRPGAAFYIFHSDSEGYNFRGAAFDVSWQIRQCLIWNKNSLVMGRQDYQWKHEPCLYGWKSGAAHYWGGDRSQTTVLDFARPTRSAEHPTMKPVPLVEYLIRNSSRRGDVVLDLFGGSGSTLIGCELSDRHAMIMELDGGYVDVIVRRWQEHTGIDAIHEQTGLTFEQLKIERQPDYELEESANDAEYDQRQRA